MNCIIFGGSGFIGTHLAKLINATYPEAKIYNLDIATQGEPLPTVKNCKSALCENESHPATYVRCDVRKSIDFQFSPTEDDIVFNFAAVHRTPGHPDHDYFETNIRGAENVCKFAEKYNIKKIVFTSSISPYGAAEDLKTEDTLPTPNTPYGISKLVAENIHKTWQAADKSRRLLILRPGVAFGKGENGNFSRLYNGLKNRKFAYPGRKDTIKACIYVKDLVKFMLWHLENSDKEVETYNCTYEPAYTIEHICQSMLKATGLKRTIMLIPTWVMMPIAGVIGAFGAPMGICPARVKKLMISTNICGKKLADSGYKFTYTFDEALADWFADNGNKCLE